MVAPVLIDRTTEKRDVHIETVTLTNTADHVIRVFPSVHEVAVDAGGTIQEFVPPSMSDNSSTVTSWLEISRARIDLQPGEAHEIPLTLRVSPTAKAGEYHAFVAFGAGSNRDEAERQATSGQAPGTIVRLSIDTTQKEFIRLSHFDVERFVTERGEGQLTFTLENPSKAPVSPSGEIIFYDSRGREVAAVPVNEDGTTIAPGSQETFVQTVPDTSVLGRHRAFLSVEYGTDQLASVHDTDFFYVVPLQQVLMIFGGILAITIIVTLLMYRRYSTGADDNDTDDHRPIPIVVRTGVQSETTEHDVNLKHHN